MPKFKVYQYRDASISYEAVIEADDAEHAQRLAEDDKCTWVYEGVSQFDDREIPLDQVEELEPDDDDYDGIKPLTVPGKIWLLHIDSDYSRSVDVYTDEQKALGDFERALENYLEPEDQERFKGKPREAWEHLHAREGGFPNGDIVRLDEHDIKVEVNSV